jgi:glucokinase
MILAGDVGGTNTRLALFELDEFKSDEKVGHPIVEESFPSRDHVDLGMIIQKFRVTYPLPITQACFGVAGPVKHGRCEATNLPWIVDAQALASELELTQVGLINDLEANAIGIVALKPTDFIALNLGEPDINGNAALISAGTGLGEAGLFWDGLRHRPIASEGGHADFSPRNELEMDLLRYLLAQFGRVSWERVLSGPGLYNLYKFFRDTGRATEPDWLREKLQYQDPPSTIAASAGQSTLCALALDLFISLYGAEAGNLALKMKATGGLFLGGGIAPKLVHQLQNSTQFVDIFMNAFTDKGRLRSLLEAIPVQVILNDKTALLGAAAWANQQNLPPPDS